jgi:hypothetical protein
VQSISVTDTNNMLGKNGLRNIIRFLFKMTYFSLFVIYFHLQGHVACIVEMRNESRILVGISEERLRINGKIILK